MKNWPCQSVIIRAEENREVTICERKTLYSL